MEQKKRLRINRKRLIINQNILLQELIRPNFLKLRAIEMLIIKMKSIALSREVCWICHHMDSTFDTLLGILSDLKIHLCREDSR